MTGKRYILKNPLDKSAKEWYNSPNIFKLMRRRLNPVGILQRTDARCSAAAETSRTYRRNKWTAEGELKGESRVRKPLGQR
jgi:hypothetical protein